jgi:hypothetical protein
MNEETIEILENARAALEAGEITAEDMQMVELICIQAETETLILN